MSVLLIRKCAMCVQCPWKPERVLGLLELGLQVVLAATWVLGTEWTSSGRTASAPNLPAICAAPACSFLNDDIIWKLAGSKSSIYGLTI